MSYICYHNWFTRIIDSKTLFHPDFEPELETISNIKNTHYKDVVFDINITDFVDYVVDSDLIMQFLYVLFVNDIKKTISNCEKLNNFYAFHERKEYNILHILSKFSRFSNLHIIKTVIDRGCDVNKQNYDSYTSLMLAARNSNTTSNIETVKLLIDNGCDVNIQNNHGWTCLMMASRYSNCDSNIDTVKLLIDSGCDVNKQENNGYTSLMMASLYSNCDSNIETVKLLIDSNSDVNKQNNNGCTSLLLAFCNSNTTSNIETVKLLIDYNSDIDIQHLITQ